MVWFLWAVMFVGMVWVLLGQLPAGWDARMPLPYMIALTPFLWIPLVLCAAAAGLLHEWGLMVCLLVVALAASTRRIAYWGTDPRPGRNTGDIRETNRETSRETHRDVRETSCETPRDESGVDGTASDVVDARSVDTAAADMDHAPAPVSLTVMTLNCRYGRADATAIVDAVRGRGIDVLALQEVSDDLVTRLDAAGIADLLPHRQSGEAKESDNGGYNMIFAAYEPVASEASAVAIPAADVPSLAIRLRDGQDVTLASAHPKSPMRGCRDWSAGIIGLGALAQHAKQDGTIAVVLGDLNSGTDHPSFRALLARGFRDASLTQGKGPNLTFPRWLPWPRIELDHVLATHGLRFSEVASFPVPGTDHLALTARLEPSRETHRTGVSRVRGGAL
ncbi:endonuclease/exonuclease/phosphatase family protein [Bifidobacterium aesculapii]|uniref:endonuclease/exonuclease/phosphatase family protein n=1 Tax=Bifidobacterium aesculapii TaxID=1329411 RepID=UPI0006E44F17|nr:endonuclease/exonuclease/phosphatase family protein [Bifidobacterium aesculapii]